MTLRKAVENLVAAGVLYKVPQLGTFVSCQSKEQPGPTGGRWKKLADTTRQVVETTGDFSETISRREAQSEARIPERADLSDPDAELIRKLMQENGELRQATDILQRVATYFARVEQDRKIRR